ncbi:MAG: hypothetical protein ACRD2C_10220 [Acidimicrobiales bacterium]
MSGERFPLGEVAAAYSEQRGRAMSASTVRLRWWERRLARTCGQHSQPGLARLKAIRDELRDRRQWAR